MLELHIGNKNYSSWSMRPWVLLRQAGIPFTEVMHRFDSFDADSGFKRTISAVSPVGKVPVLVDGDLLISGIRWPLPSIWRNSIRSTCYGPKTVPPARVPAASAPKCTVASRRCAVPAP